MISTPPLICVVGRLVYWVGLVVGGRRRLCCHWSSIDLTSHKIKKSGHSSSELSGLNHAKFVRHMEIIGISFVLDFIILDTLLQFETTATFRPI